MGGFKSALNRAESSLKSEYFSRLRGRPKKDEPQPCTTESRVWDGSTVCTAGQGNPCHGHKQWQTPSRGQWEGGLWCWRQALLRQGAPGLMGIIFLRSLCCCQFSALSRQKEHFRSPIAAACSQHWSSPGEEEGASQLSKEQLLSALLALDFKILRKTGHLQEKLP